MLFLKIKTQYKIVSKINLQEKKVSKKEDVIQHIFGNWFQIKHSETVTLLSYNSQGNWLVFLINLPFQTEMTILAIIIFMIIQLFKNIQVASIIRLFE